MLKLPAGEWPLARRALASMETGDWKAALADLDAALGMARDPFLFRLRSVCLEKSGRMPDALAALDRAIALGDKGSEILAQRGHLLFYLKRYAESARAYAAASRRDPADGRLPLSQAEAFWLDGERRTAARLARKAQLKDLPPESRLAARWIAGQGGGAALNAGRLMQARDYGRAAKAFAKAPGASDFFGLRGLSGEKLAKALAFIGKDR